MGKSSSATHGRPTLIPSNDRGAKYGRRTESNVQNPKGGPYKITFDPQQLRYVKTKEVRKGIDVCFCC
jgi:hypothetical protein